MSEPLKQYYLSFVLYRRSITKWADMKDECKSNAQVNRPEALHTKIFVISYRAALK